METINEEPHLVTVTNKDITEAYNNFLSLYFPGQNGKGLYFWAFIGMKSSPQIYNHPTWRLPPEAAHCVRLLAGPYSTAIAKIMEANGYQWSTPVTQSY